MSVFTSPWVPAIVLALLASAARALAESWLAPSAFVGLLSSVFVWASMLAADYPVYPSAVWVIVLFVLFLQLGLFIGETLVGRRPPAVAEPETENSNSRLLSSIALRFSAIFAVVAFVGTLYFIFWSFSRFDLPASPI